MYKFIKIKVKGWTKGQWYFQPQSVQDINDFFDTVVRSEIQDGLHDAEEGLFRTGAGHYTTAWAKGVALFQTHGGGVGWAMASTDLENKTYRDRIAELLDGKEPLFANGMQWLNMSCVDEILEEAEKKELVFPAEYSIDNVRYMQWGLPGNKGKHWYAKIETMDIRDEAGNMKWDTRKEAEEAAKWFIEHKL